MFNKSDLEYINRHIDPNEAIKLTQDLVREESTNPPGNELSVTELLAEALKERNIEVEIDVISRDRANLIARLNGGGGTPKLLFNGHLDTVPAGGVDWKYDPFGGEIHDGRLYGVGSSDMKSGLASMVVAAGAIKRLNIDMRKELVITATAGEETDSIGARKLLGTKELDGVETIVIGEPTANKIVNAQKGALWLEFTTIGRTAHGAMPELGDNAITLMKQVMEWIYKINTECESFEFGKPTVNIGTIKGGVKTNVVPDYCQMTVDIRTVPGQSHSEIIKSANKFAKGLGKVNERDRCNIKVLNDRIPVVTSHDNHAVKFLLEIAEAVLCNKEPPKLVNYYTDASIFRLEKDIPVIIFGPGENRKAHQPDEYVELTTLKKATEFYAALIFAYTTCK